MYRDGINIYADKKFMDITDLITEHIKISKVIDGMLYVHSMHTTCGLKIMENELLSLSDIDDFLKRIVSDSIEYAHDKIDLRQVPQNERINGISHVRMLFFNTDIAIPICDGKPLLGEWQRLFLIETDGTPARTRKIIITIINEC
jgi:secondary thiamine-phosphate synthase enzyme